MKLEIIRLAVGDRFKYNEKSPEFEIVSFVPSRRFTVSEFCNAKNLETGFVMQHSTDCTVYVPPYDDFYKQLTLF